MRAVLIAVAALLASTPASATEDAASAPRPIQDNSFLIEEAYNQEARVVQHISAFSRSTDGASWVYAFTQEWPIRSQTHQLSVTVPFQNVEMVPESETGLGDLAVNYRWQALGSGEAPVAFAPRVSLLLPTGDEANGFGAGGPGVQANLPVSAVLGERFVTHVNLGGGYTPKAQDPLGNEAATASFFAGQSLVWLAHPRLNLLVEALWSQFESVAGADRTETGEAFFVSPGVRGAIDFDSGLQVVPGIAMPIGVGPSDGERALFLYLSLEHPF